MGLRDFLLGAQQFQSGLEQYGQSSSAQALRDELPGLLEQMRSGDPRAQEEAAARYYDLQGRSGGKGGALDPQIAQSLFASMKQKPEDSPLSLEEIETVGSGLLNKSDAEKISKLKDRKAQEKAIAVKQGLMKEEGVQYRSDRQAGIQTKKMDIANYKDFNKSLQDNEIKFDDAKKGLESALAQFKAGPNKGTLQQLAVALARAGGDTGVLSDQDLASYKLSTLPQTLAGWESFVTDKTNETIVDSVKDELVRMAEFGISQSEKRKENRLKTVFENNVSVYGQNFLKDQKPDVIKNWEKRLGLVAEKTKEGVQVKKQVKEYSGNSATAASSLSKTKDEASKAMAEKQLNAMIKARGGKDLEPGDIAIFENFLKSKKLIKE